MLSVLLAVNIHTAWNEARIPMSHAELPGSLEDGGLSLWIVRRLRGQGLEHHWKMPHAASEIKRF